MRKKALSVAFSIKKKKNQIFFFDKLELEAPKTGILNKIVENLRKSIDGLEKGKTLIILPERKEDVSRASRNIPDLKVRDTGNVNSLDLLKAKYILFSKDAVKLLEERICQS